MNSNFYKIIFLFLNFFVFESCTTRKTNFLNEKHQGYALIGSWEGVQNISLRYSTGFIKYTFLKSPNQLKTSIKIDANGEVIGYIGKAQFKSTRVITNRGPLLRKLGWATDYSIKGKLIGKIFEGDSIQVKTVSIPLLCDSFTITGDIFIRNGMDLFPMGTIHLTRAK